MLFNNSFLEIEMEFEYIVDTYGALIWKTANRYYTGMWQPLDVYHELILKLHTAVNNGKLKNLEDQTIKSFIITKAIDLVRKELYRRSLSKTHLANRTPADEEVINTFQETMESTTGTVDESKIASDVEEIRDLLFTRLPERDATFIFELAFPSYTVIQIAIRDQQEKIADPALRMGVNKLLITPNHVSEFMKLKFGAGVSKATVCRIRKRTVEALQDIVG